MTEANPLAGLRPAGAPGELRGRVLAAAARARAVGLSRPHWIDRAWESRGLRVAWSLALLAAFFGYLGGEKAAESTALHYGWIASVGVSDSLSEARQVDGSLP